MIYSDDVSVSFDDRDPLAGVDPLFPERWSPRSFKKIPVAVEDLAIVLDAARWSPSAMNEQPWQFYTSTEASFPDFHNLLLPGNQSWAGNASVLGFIVTKRHYQKNAKENSSCEFDAGAAWMAMTLQARQLGLYTHAMGGIDKKGIYKYLNLQKKYFTVLAGFALGVIDTIENLPYTQRAREKPSGRKLLKEIWTQV